MNIIKLKNYKYFKFIKNNYNSDTFYNTLENVAYNSGFCIEITSDNETIYSNIKNNKGCIDSNSNARSFKRKIRIYE